MRLARRLLVVALAGVTLLPVAARGAGYSIYEQGAAVLGMAGAGTASVSDPSAIYFNPAALTWLTGTRFYGGGTFLQTFTSFAGVAPYPGFGVTEEMEPQRLFPPTAYLSHRYPGPWAIGIGFNSPFGLAVEWKKPGEFTGRYIVTSLLLRTENASLVAARQLGRNLSVGFGGNLIYSRVTSGNRVFIAAPGGGGAQFEVANFKYVSDVTPGYGWNFGLSWTPAKSLRIGWLYHGRVIIHSDGISDFTLFPTGDAELDAAVAAALPPDHPEGTATALPAIRALGVAWNWGSRWTIEGDAVQTQSSVFEDYDNTFQFRVGAEHRLPAFTYRFGYYFDQAAAPTESVSPLLPDADRHGATLGLGLGFGPDKRLALDLYQLALFAKNRKTEGVNRNGYEGEYKTFASATGMSLAYRW